MLGIQFERTTPQLVRLAAVVSLVRDVAELEVDVVAQLRRELDGALIQAPRFIVARAAIRKVAEILGELRQRGLVVQCGTRQFLRLRQIPRQLMQHREVVAQDAILRIRFHGLRADLFRGLEVPRRGGREGTRPKPDRGHFLGKELLGTIEPSRGAGVIALLEGHDAPADVDPRIRTRACRRLRIRRLGVFQPAQLLEGQGEIVEHRGPGAALLCGEPQRLHRFAPARLLERDESNEEMGVGIRAPELRDATEFPRGFVQHAGLVKGDPQIAMLFDARVRHLLVFGARGPAGAMQESRGHEPVQGFPDFELAQSRVFDDLIHVARSVEQRQQAVLHLRELRIADRKAIAVHQEDQVEGGDLFLDQAPLIHPARAFEQQRFRIDGDKEVLLLGADVSFEVERPLGPCEQIVDRLLDLHAHVALELLLREDALADEDLAQLLVALLGLAVDRGVELFLADLLVLHEDVAEAVAAIDDRRVTDPAFVEIDVSEVRAVGDRETAGLLPEREQLEHVGERGLFERAFDGH